MNETVRLNPANLLTLFRILTVPVVVLLLYTPGGGDIPFSHSVAAVILFTVSSFTDLFDGYIARRYQIVTSLGMVFLVAGLILTAWSGLDYFFRFVKEIFK